jgi:pyruvate,water dikinase
LRRRPGGPQDRLAGRAPFGNLGRRRRSPAGLHHYRQVYRDALAEAGAWAPAARATGRAGLADIAKLAERAGAARRIVYEVYGGPPLSRQIRTAWRALKVRCGGIISVAVRSSATAEDLPTARFAGQYESFLNVRGEAGLIEACRRCFASIFTERVIGYRLDNGFDHFKVALSVEVMKMVRWDIEASGVIFILDTETGFPDVVFVTGGYGLGEIIVQSAIEPDEFHVHKPTYRQGFSAVLRRRLGAEQLRIVYAHGADGADGGRTRPTARRAGPLLPERRGRPDLGRRGDRHR